MILNHSKRIKILTYANKGELVLINGCFSLIKLAVIEFTEIVFLKDTFS